MPGKRTDGTINNCKGREARAFCEGRAASAAAALRTTNPFPSWSDDYDAWDRGWVDEDAGNPRENCAE